MSPLSLSRCCPRICCPCLSSRGPNQNPQHLSQLPLIVSADFDLKNSSRTYSYQGGMWLSAQRLAEITDTKNNTNTETETVPNKEILSEYIIKTKSYKDELIRQIVRDKVSGEKLEKSLTVLARLLIQEEILRGLYKSENVQLINLKIQKYDKLSELDGQNFGDNNFVKQYDNVDKVLENVKEHIRTKHKKNQLHGLKIKLKTVEGAFVDNSLFFIHAYEGAVKKQNSKFENHKLQVLAQAKGDPTHKLDSRKKSWRRAKKVAKGFIFLGTFPLMPIYNKCAKGTWLGSLNYEGKFPVNKIYSEEARQIFNGSFMNE